MLICCRSRVEAGAPRSLRWQPRAEPALVASLHALMFHASEAQSAQRKSCLPVKRFYDFVQRIRLKSEHEVQMLSRQHMLMSFRASIDALRWCARRALYAVTIARVIHMARRYTPRHTPSRYATLRALFALRGASVAALTLMPERIRGVIFVAIPADCRHAAEASIYLLLMRQDIHERFACSRMSRLRIVLIYAPTSTHFFTLITVFRRRYARRFVYVADTRHTVFVRQEYQPLEFQRARARCTTRRKGYATALGNGNIRFFDDAHSHVSGYDCALFSLSSISLPHLRIAEPSWPSPQRRCLFAAGLYAYLHFA